ncbi:MAG: DUF885 domain-containing protein [Planctomycetota bacterium]|jgi:uncharacterized protein (DUF885 family)
MRTPLTVVSILAAGVLLGAGQAADPTESLHALFQEWFDWQLFQYPEMAMARGDYTHADQVTDHSLRAIERRHRQTQAFLERLRGIDTEGLDRDDLLDYELFDLQLTNAVEGHRFRMFLAPLGGRYGLHQQIPQMGERVRFAGDDDYVNYLKRLGQVPKLVHDTIDLLRTGLQEGRTPPRVTLLGLTGQFQAILDGGLDALVEPCTHMPASINEARRQELRRRFDEEVFPVVWSAVSELEEYVVNRYIPGCRETIAAADLPDGEAYYAHQLRVMTTTDLTPTGIHELGLQEVERIKAEMMQVIRSSDFMQRYLTSDEGGDDKLFQAFLSYLRSDPRFYHQTEEDLLVGYRDICKRVDAHLPALFRTLPRLPYGVRKIPAFMAPSQTTAYYRHGDIRNAEPGYFYANTHALDQRPKYEMIPLALHEAVPGHHLQIAIAQELEGLPEFRKDAYVTAFGEGWALYAERLGLEMGLYDDPYDDFGRLLYEMWRACRLVVDTGMHALGWSRDRAIQFMVDNTALSRLNIENEIDRYISWPGQACAYKIGELKIRELRKAAEEGLGKRFDVREFHDVVLGDGAVPLTVLESRVMYWMNAKRFETYD